MRAGCLYVLLLCGHLLSCAFCPHPKAGLFPLPHCIPLDGQGQDVGVLLGEEPGTVTGSVDGPGRVSGWLLQKKLWPRTGPFPGLLFVTFTICLFCRPSLGSLPFVSKLYRYHKKLRQFSGFPS